MEFLQRTPFFRLLLPFIAGIILYLYVEFAHGVLYVQFVLSIMFIAGSFIIKTPKTQYQYRWLFGSGITVFMLSLAYLICIEQDNTRVFDHLYQKGIYRVELISSPVEKAKSYRCDAKVISCYRTFRQPAHGKAILYFQKDQAASNLLVGDRLLVEARFTPPERALNPDAFDYGAYLKRQGIGATAYIPSGTWRVTDRNTSFSVRREAAKWQQYLLDVYRKFHISGDNFSVLAALTLGYTDDLQPDVRASYSATGVVHILSVSGMHVGIVYVVMAFLLGFMDKTPGKRIFKGLFIVLFLWGYAFLTGMSAAVVRSALMFSFISLATCFERKSQIYNTVFMSMLCMLIVNPSYLYDVGFQLSYAAVLSIVFFKPIVDKIYTPTTKTVRFVWTMLSVSLAAQAGTTPFTLFYFHQFPNYFLLTNFIAIPLSTLIIYLAMGLLVVSILPVVSVGVAYMLDKSVGLLNLIIVTIEHLPFSISIISLDIRQSVFLLLAILCLSGYYFSRKFAPLVAGVSALLIVTLFSIQVNYHTLTSRRMIVYAGQKNTHVSFINRNKNYVFTTDSVELKHIARAFWQNQQLENPVYLHKNPWFNNGFANYEGCKMLVLTQSVLTKKTTGTPLELDYLIIGNRLKPRIEQLMECIHPRKIIVDRSISKWYCEHIRQYCRSRKIGFYSVAEQGAYIVNIKD